MLTGDIEGVRIAGMCSRVETAGALVSPLGSAPSPLDLRRGRAMLKSISPKVVAACLNYVVFV